MIEASVQQTPTSPAGLEDQVGAAESRRDPITGDWTIFAPYRDQRPDEFHVTHKANGTNIECPFCKGHESSTPPHVWVRCIDGEESAITDPVDPTANVKDDWSVRVVPNKYPVVASALPTAGIEAAHLHAGRAANAGSDTRGRREKTSLFESRPVVGGHEVIIESPKHVESLTDLNFSEVALVFEAYRDRLRYWRSHPDIRFISIFKNAGGEAGASMTHTHSQLIATNEMPRHVAKMVDRMRRHQASTGCCLQCDLIRGELKDKRRIVSQSDSLVAFCPHASRLPMLVRITTKEHRDRFDDLSRDTMEDVTRMVVRVIGWLEELHPGASYNYLLQTRPPGAAGADEAYHWSLDIFPRLTQVAGFEWGTHCMINPVLPEVAAAKYRACAAAEDPRLVR